MIALIVALLFWSNPAPTLYACAPGKTPLSAPSSCARVHFSVLSKFPAYREPLR